MGRAVPIRSARITTHGAMRLSPDVLGPDVVSYLFVKLDGGMLCLRLAPAEGFTAKRLYVSNRKASNSVMLNVGREIGQSSVSLEEAMGEYTVESRNGEYQIKLRRANVKARAGKKGGKVAEEVAAA